MKTVPATTGARVRPTARFALEINVPSRSIASVMGCHAAALCTDLCRVEVFDRTTSRNASVMSSNWECHVAGLQAATRFVKHRQPVQAGLQTQKNLLRYGCEFG